MTENALRAMNEGEKGNEMRLNCPTYLKDRGKFVLSKHWENYEDGAHGPLEASERLGLAASG